MSGDIETTSSARPTVYANVAQPTVYNNAAQPQVPSRAMQVSPQEDWILKSMKVDCTHLGQLKETSSQLEIKRLELQHKLTEQNKILEALKAQPLTVQPDYPKLACGDAPPTSQPNAGGVSAAGGDLKQLACGNAPPTSQPNAGGVSAVGGDLKQPNAGGVSAAGGDLKQVLPSIPRGGRGIPHARNDSRLEWKLDKEVKIHSGPVNGVTMGKASDTIATASSDGSASFVDLSANQVVQTFTTAAKACLTAVAFSKTDEEHMACPSSDQSVYLWNLKEGVLKHRFVGHTDEVTDIDFHPTQSIMATVSSDRKCMVWDVFEGSTLRSLEGHSAPVFSCTFLGHQNPFLVATGCLDRSMRIFDMRDKTEVRRPKEHSAGVMGIDYCTAKELMVSAAEDGTICAWDTRTWTCLWETRAWTMSPRTSTREAKQVKRVALSPNGLLLASACGNGQVLIFEANTGMHVASLDGHAACAADVAWGVEAQTGAKLLISASHDGTCRLWRAPV